MMRVQGKRRWLTIALFIALLVSPDRISGKTDVWSHFALRGETVSALALAGPGDVYAGTSSGAILRVVYRVSTPLVQNLAGDSSPISALAVDPHNPDVVYAATNSRLFRSRDGGITWTALGAAPVGVVEIAIDPRESNILYASARAFGLFRTTDAGESWIRTSLAESVEKLVIDPNDPTTIYAATSIGIARSNDRGERWTISPELGSVRTLAIDPATPTTLYSSTNEGVFKSVDAGAHWVASGMEGIPVFSLVIDNQDTCTIYAATATGAFKSVDAGKNWLPVDQGLAFPVTAMIGDLALCRIYVATADGILETDIGPVLTIHSTLCVDSPWTVVVSHGGGNSPIHLFGSSNGSIWEIPDWGITDGSGKFTTSGRFAADTTGTHQLRVEVNGMTSNTIHFSVVSVGNSTCL